MATPTFDLLGEATISGNATNSITFNGLDQSYKDLTISYTGKCTNASDQLRMYFNGVSTGGKYGGTVAENDGTDFFRAFNYGTMDKIYSSYNYSDSKSDKVTSIWFEVFNYTLSGQRKPFITKTAGAAGNTLMVGQVANTGALTSVTLDYTGNFADGATVSIYGVVG